MASQRDAPRRSASTDDHANAEALPDEAAQPSDTNNSGSDGVAPRAGRTGKLGGRAERPSDSRSKKSGNGTPEPTRGTKPPPPAARDGQPGAAELPQPARDSTA